MINWKGSGEKPSTQKDYKQNHEEGNTGISMHEGFGHLKLEKWQW